MLKGPRKRKAAQRFADENGNKAVKHLHDQPTPACLSAKQLAHQ